MQRPVLLHACVLLGALVACSRTPPEHARPAVPVATPAPPLKLSQPPDRLIRLVERIENPDGEGFDLKHIAYRRPRRRIPERYLKARGDDGRWVEVHELIIGCENERCFVGTDDGLLDTERGWRHAYEVPRSSLTWLPTTDLLGLPPERGGWVATPDDVGRREQVGCFPDPDGGE